MMPSHHQMKKNGQLNVWSEKAMLVHNLLLFLTDDFAGH
jgi:hypothetical protein